MTDQPVSDHNRILSPSERRRRNRDEVTTAILEAAQAIMREDGVAALNLNEVARRVGMKTPSLYEYFPGKMAIYDRLFLIGIRLFGKRIMRGIESTTSPLDELRLTFENYMGFAQEYPEFFKLLFERHVPGFEPSAATMDESYQILLRGRARLQAIIDGGVIAPPLPTEQAHDLLIALLHGLASQHLANEPQLPIGEGRYGSLIPAAVNLLLSVWGVENRSSSSLTNRPEPGKDSDDAASTTNVLRPDEN